MSEWVIENLVIPTRRLWRNATWRTLVLAFGVGLTVKLAVNPVNTAPPVAPQGSYGGQQGVAVAPPASSPPPSYNVQQQRARRAAAASSPPAPPPVVKLTPSYELPEGGVQVRPFHAEPQENDFARY